MFIDTHCHISLDDYDDIDLLIKNIKNSGVNYIIVNGTSKDSNEFVLELVKKYDIVYGALGFHPTELDLVTEDDFLWLDKHINDEKIVAVGEIGLDYHYDNTDKEKQMWAFEKQLEIASKYSKPVIIHTRDSIGDTYDTVKKYTLTGSIHCFSGSLEMAMNFIKLGYKIGIGGVVTYKNAKNIVNVIKNVDLEYILLETDAPYLAPEPKRGEKNSSCNIPIIAKKIADLKGVSVALVGKVTTENAIGLFDFFKILC